MRLTKTGYEAFVQMDLEHYDFAVDPMSVTSRLIIAMDRKLQMPYYILFKKQVPVKIIFYAYLTQYFNYLLEIVSNYYSLSSLWPVQVCFRLTYFIFIMNSKRYVF